MNIVCHTLDVDADWRLGDGRAAAIDVRPFDPAADAVALRSLVEACQTAATRTEPPFAPAGIAAELVSRRGRQVHALLAWSRVEPCPAVGIVALVEAGEREPRRFSIAWLLVHPQARRRGIATALVRHALDAARSRGAHTVAAETLRPWRSAALFWRTIAAHGERR